MVIVMVMGVQFYTWRLMKKYFQIPGLGLSTFINIIRVLRYQILEWDGEYL